MKLKEELENRLWKIYLRTIQRGTSIYLLRCRYVWTIRSESGEMWCGTLWAMFICLARRSVQIEVTHNVESLIQARKRLIACRVKMRQIRIKNDCNFDRVKEKLWKVFTDINLNKIENLIHSHGGNYIIWRRNQPASSNMGSIWGCQKSMPELF